MKQSNARLVWITPDAEAVILYIARVSSDQENTDTNLIKFLVRQKHWSPFDMANMCVEIETSRAIATQFLRHGSFKFQEFSQRYASPKDAIRYLGRRQADSNRQSSIDNLADNEQQWFIDAQEVVIQRSFLIYREALKRGIARESARFLLPLSTQTKLYMNGTIRSWIHYLALRTTEDTQTEHRSLAVMVRTIFQDNLPVIAEALEL